MNLIRSIFFLLLLWINKGVFAQGPVTVKATVNKNRIIIGERFELVIETTSTGGPRFLTIDTIPYFEFALPPKIDTSETADLYIVKGVYALTSFDSGHWVIPAFRLSAQAKTDTIPIDVVFSEFNPSQPYHTIKDIIETETAKKKWEWWWYAAAALLFAALAYYYFSRKKTPVTRTPAPALGPYEEAMQKLDLLASNRVSDKVYYSMLTDIFRVYIDRKKGIRSMQKTTADLVSQIEGTGLKKESFDELGRTLRLADFVKFARYVPSADDDSQVFQTIRDVITQIEQLEPKPLVAVGMKK